MKHERTCRLELRPLHRPYEELDGGFRSGRESLDFIVDGQSLFELIKADVASRLGFRSPGVPRNLEWDRPVVEKLMLRAPEDFPHSRYALYVCPECADFGCGTVTAKIEAEGDLLRWSQFGWETDYDEPNLEAFPHIGPFHFNAVDYERVISESIAPD